MRKNKGEKKKGSKKWLVIAVIVLILVGLYNLGSKSEENENAPIDGSAALIEDEGGMVREAADIEPVSEEIQTQPVVSETKTPETKAPETKAPETKAPETKAPETKAPETKAPETKAPETKAPETKVPETEAPKEKTGIRADFKEFWDSYEAFIKEYCEFMKSCSDGITLDKLTKYTEFLTKVSEWTEKADNYKGSSGDWTKDETNYYLEVNNRVLQLLAQAAEAQKKAEETEDPAKVAPETQAPETEAPKQTSTGIRPEYKEFWDSYEAFMKEYCDFMKKYSESGNALTMMTDYLAFIQKYADFTQKAEQYSSSSAQNDEETKYILEVESRVLKMLAEVAY